MILGHDGTCILQGNYLVVTCGLHLTSLCALLSCEEEEEEDGDV